MNHDEAIAGLESVRSVPVPNGVGLWSDVYRLGDDQWGVRAELSSGGMVRCGPLLFTAPIGPDDVRLLATKAKQIADQSCVGTGVVESDDPGASEPRPQWMREAAFGVVMVSATNEDLRGARLLANTLLADLEAGDLPVKSIWATADAIVMQWRNHDKRVNVEAWLSGLRYKITPSGFSCHSEPFWVNVSWKRVGKRLVGYTRPDLLRSWLSKLFYDHESLDYGFDADEAMRESGWWTEDEIDAICGPGDWDDELLDGIDLDERWEA